MIRTSWLYAASGSNFVLAMARLLRERELVRVVDDQRGTPTSADWLAEATLRLLELEERGLFHVTDGGECSRFELACTVKRFLSAPALVEPCSSLDFRAPAKRPRYSVLDVTETEKRIGPAPGFATNLARVLRAV
jgi:dTDP-4-dehydrorhamnose reductase